MKSTQRAPFELDSGAQRPSLRVHKRAPFELDTEAVMGEHLRKDPQGTSLLKSRAKRTSLPMDQTDEDKTPGTPSPPHVLCIWPVSEVHVERAQTTRPKKTVAQVPLGRPLSSPERTRL